MMWVRIDNRLIHGQVIETWLPYTSAQMIIVANDELAQDALNQEIMSLAIPKSQTSKFVSVDQLPAMLSHPPLNNDNFNSLVLFSNCTDAKRAYMNGFIFETLNIGNVHYKPGRKQLSPSIALSGDDEECLKYLGRSGVDLDFRCVPNDPVQVRFSW